MRTVPGSTLLDLVLPRECGGCRMPGTGWCVRCAERLAGAEPRAVHPRVVVGAPAWSAGPYGGPWRTGLLALKERGRRDLADPLGTALAAALAHLLEWGELDPPELAPLVLVVAPSRARAARSRGGDPVLAVARAAAGVLTTADGPVAVCAPLRTAARARDSVGLGAAQREENLRGRVRVRSRALPPAGSTVVVVDDVLSTGATAAAAVAALTTHRVRVHGVLVLAAVS